MKQHETWLQHLSSCLELARTIVFALAGFSLAAIYIAVFGSAAQRAELASQQAERARIVDILKDADGSLSKIRAFYEGPAEAQQLNFASLIYALEITAHHLDQTMHAVGRATLPPADAAFLDFKSALVRDNVFELGAVIGGLIKQKRDRVPFEALPAADLLDLDYHKGKDAWDLYYDWSSLRYALYTKESYGYRPLPPELDSLEKRFRYQTAESQKSRQSNTRPPKAGRDPQVSSFVQKMVASGFGNVGELRSRLAALDGKIREQEKAIGGSLKLPFVDQSVEVDYLIWLVPLTVLMALAFTIFYVQRASDICRWLIAAKSELRIGAQAFPWVLLVKEENESRGTVLLGRFLKITLIALPLSVPLLLIAGSSGGSAAGRTAGLFLSLVSLAAAWLLLGALRTLRTTLWSPVEVSSPEATSRDAA